MDDPLLEAAQAIAEGRAVDWDALALRCEPGVLDELRHLAELATCFGNVDLDQQRAAASAPRFAHLTLGEELGRGGGGVVYRAHDPLLQRDVALKLCPPDHAAASDLLREAQLMARVDHPGVLKVHGATRVDGQVGFWSDLVQGEPLSTVLAREPRLGASTAIALGVEVCAALAAIHSVGLSHGDVKADNIVRQPGGRVVLIDFGSSSPQSAGMAMSGTPLYLPRERLEGAAPTRADDLYGLGVLLFHAVCGRYPVEADSIADLLAAHSAQRRNHLVDLRPDLPAAFIDVVERAVASEPARRFASAGALAEALRDALPNSPEDDAANRPRPDGTAVARSASGATLPWQRRGYAKILLGLAATLLVAGFWLAHSRPAPLAAVRMQLLRTSAGGEAPLHDGDRLALGDTLALDLELATSSHVYVLDEDAQGALFQLFPLAQAELGNPLPGERRLRLPGRVRGADVHWQVTSRGRRERLYVIVSPTAIDDLDPRSDGLSQAELGRPIDRSRLTERLAMRGVGGLAPAAPPTADRWLAADWLAELGSRHRGLDWRKFELDNPD